MQRILPLELVGQDRLNYNIYNEKEELICKKGEELTSSLLIKLCHIKIYIKDDDDKDYNYPAVIDVPKISKYQSLISDEVTRTLLSISKTLLKKIREKEKPDNYTYNEAMVIITDEVSKQVERIECISQLKIFDEYNFSHMINVSVLSCVLGIALGFEWEEIKEVALGALLHDVGKVFVPQDILNKPAPLDEDEFEIMKSHTLLGYKYLKENMDIPDKVAKVALDHQEKYGGGGYPQGLKGNEINIYAQITAIADTYDALTSNKVYKKAVDSNKAIDIMLKEGDKQFNPYILTKFMQLVDYNNKRAIDFG